jgi:phosphomannomutase
MSIVATPQPPSEYICPGQKHPISRAVHLGRLAAFYPGCRQCPHRDDTATLSPRQVEQLQDVRAAGTPRALFHDEGAGGVYLNELTPTAARQLALAFGVMLRDKGLGNRDWGLEEAECTSGTNPQSPIPNPCVLLAGDARPITAEVSAAVGEGLRLGGGNVTDVGRATAAALAFAVHDLQAAGGILVGNPGQLPHRVGLQFWLAGPRPLSLGGSLEPLVELFHAGVDRPTRSCGALHRVQADSHYLEVLAPYYHALRPLRIVVDSASRPAVEYLQKLAASVACEVIPCPVTRSELPEQIRSDAAHLAVCIDGDGECCHVLDEQGREAPTGRLLLLLAKQSLEMDAAAAGQLSIVLEESTPSDIVQRIEQLGTPVVLSGVRRAEMAAAMTAHSAALGGGPSGRFWYREAGVPLPDALMTVTRLLVLLSRSDEPLSAVLDHDAPL